MTCEQYTGTCNKSRQKPIVLVLNKSSDEGHLILWNHVTFQISRLLLFDGHSSQTEDDKFLQEESSLLRKSLNDGVPQGSVWVLLLLVCIMGCYADQTNLNAITLPIN